MAAASVPALLTIVVLYFTEKGLRLQQKIKETQLILENMNQIVHKELLDCGHHPTESDKGDDE